MRVAIGSDLKNTQFVVSSKSGSTLEPNICRQYFFSRVEQLLGPRRSLPSLRCHYRSRERDHSGRSRDNRSARGVRP
jgi:hypothetical protein